jgi:uncharacterized membrane protein
MLTATLIFSGWNWLWLVVVGLAGAGTLLAWNYRPAPTGVTRILCAGLKFLGFLALALCLLEPLWSGQRARPGANVFAVVADNSQGLRIRDHGASGTRGEALRDLLNPQRRAWLGLIEDEFEVRRYLFDSRLQASKDFSDLTFEGRSSAIGSALRTLSERYRNRPLAGVLLLTDGNATDLKAAPDIDGLPPVYPVVLGSLEPIRDIAVQQVQATQTAFEDAPVSVEAEVRAVGFAGQEMVAQLSDQVGKAVSTQTLRARKTDERLTFRFQLRPDTPGLIFYRFNVREKSELERPGSSPSAEATLANNTAVIAINRGRGPYRILYLAGQPNWDFKFLNRAAGDDPQLELVALVRIASREPKFTFMGRAGESSNPLFRGFGNQSPDEVERYDQPVVERLYMRDKLELQGGFPRAAAELYQYDAVVVGKLGADFFAPDQQALLQRFVSERGGGFLMLGGAESFQEGGYQRTPIGDMLPVYLDRPEAAHSPGPFRYDLTPEGWLQPWARLRDNEAAERTRIQTMTPFQVLNQVRETKPGATLIATVTDAADKRFPALSVQRFGRGRTAALTVGDVWRWGFKDQPAHQDMDKFWRQMLRWLVADVPKRVELTAEPQAEDPNGAVRLEVRVRNAEFQPLDNAGVSLEIQPLLVTGAAAAETNALRLAAEPAGAEPGLYQAQYVPRLTGGYKATAYVTNDVGAEVGRAEAGWSTDLAADEFRSLTPNLPLLEAIAKRTGGELVPADRLEEFARRLPHLHAPVLEAWTFPLWNTPAMFGFALACLIGEWGLRRWKGLP